MKKRISPFTYVFIAVILLGSIAGGAFYMFRQQIIISETDYVCPGWTRLECAKSDTPTIISERAIHEQTYLCSMFVDECYFDFVCDNEAHFITYKTYDARGNIIEYKEETTGFSNVYVPVGGKVSVICENIWNVDKDFTTTLKYHRYGLYSFYNGAKDLVKSGDCSISDKKTRVYGEDWVDTIPKGNWVNYVNKWVYCLGTNYHDHTKYGKVYCEGAGLIYKPAYFDTADGKRHYIGESDYELPEFSTVSLMPAEPLPKEDCCPGQIVAGQCCGTDFKWYTGTECGCQASIDCSEGGQWYCEKSKVIARYQCVDNKCIKTTQTVNCCQDADCLHLGTTWHCKPRDWVCEQDVEPPFCGDGNCDSSESQSTCCDDCGCPVGYDCIKNVCTKKENGDGEAACLERGGIWIREEVGKCNILCQVGITKPIIVVTEYCKTPFDWDKWLPWIIISGSILLAIIVIVAIRSAARKQTTHPRHHK